MSMRNFALIMVKIFIQAPKLYEESEHEKLRFDKD